MITVAIECSTRSISLALLEEERLRGEIYCDLDKHHSEMLIPLLGQLFQMTGGQIGIVDLWACSLGPGSFTSLRIGVSTIKGLAFATGKPVTGASTLAIMASTYLNPCWNVCSLLDAKGMMVYAGLYRYEAGGIPVLVGEERLIEIDRLLQGLSGAGRVFFVGDGAVKHKEAILASTDGEALVAETVPRLSAYWVGLLGRWAYQKGGVLDPCTFTPRYLRGSDARISC